MKLITNMMNGGLYATARTGAGVSTIGHAGWNDVAVMLEGPVKNGDPDGLDMCRVHFLTGEAAGKEGWMPFRADEISTIREATSDDWVKYKTQLDGLAASQIAAAVPAPKTSPVKKIYLVVAPHHDPTSHARFRTLSESPEKALEVAGLHRTRLTDRTSSTHPDTRGERGTDVKTAQPSGSHEWKVYEWDEGKPWPDRENKDNHHKLVAIYHSRSEIGGTEPYARAAAVLELNKAVSTPTPEPLKPQVVPPAVAPTDSRQIYLVPKPSTDDSKSVYVVRVPTAKSREFVYYAVKAPNWLKAVEYVGLRSDLSLAEPVVLCTHNPRGARAQAPSSGSGWYGYRLSDEEAAVLKTENLPRLFDDRDDGYARYDDKRVAIDSLYREGASKLPAPAPPKPVVEVQPMYAAISGIPQGSLTPGQQRYMLRMGAKDGTFNWAIVSATSPQHAMEALGLTMKDGKWAWSMGEPGLWNRNGAHVLFLTRRQEDLPGSEGWWRCCPVSDDLVIKLSNAADQWNTLRQLFRDSQEDQLIADDAYGAKSWWKLTTTTAPTPEPIPPPVQEPAKETTMPTPTKSEVMLNTLKVDADAAAWRVAGSQLVKLVREPLCALLCRHLDANDESMRSKIASFLETDVGTAMLEAMLAMALSSMPQMTNGVPQKLGQELRIAAMADSADVIASLVMGPLMKVVTTYLQGVPVEAEPEKAPATLDAPKEQLTDSPSLRVVANQS